MKILNFKILLQIHKFKKIVYMLRQLLRFINVVLLSIKILKGILINESDK